MGRSNRGGGGAGRGGRGGARRGGPAGGGGGRHQGRPGQPAPAAPMGEALLVELRATPGFYKALKGRECPARSHEGASGATPLGTSQLEMGDWKDLGALLGWFRDGVAADPEAELAFSPKLTKALRASVHGTATAVGLGGLGTSSRGLGEERRVVVMAKTRADRALPVLDEKQDHQAFWTYRWAQQAGLQVSRDEVTEMVVKGALTPQLQAIWDTQAARQKAVQQLCTAVAAGDLAAAEAALTAQPGLLADKMFDVESGVAPLHVAAREGQVAALELLLSRGADIEMLDGHGWTALQVSRKFEQSDAEGALLRAGAHDPDKGKSILDRPAAQRATKPTAAPAPAPAAQNGTAPVAKPASASPAAPPSEGALDGDSNVSVCGTERDNAAADVSSNADDYVDLQYQAGGTVFEAVAEEEAGDGEGAAAASDSARAQAEAVALAAQAAAEAEAAAAEAAEEEAAEAAAAEAAAEVAAEVAINAFNVALAAAEAAEAAAEEAEGLGGSEAAERAAAFRHECDAAVAAVAAAAVAAGESQYIDDVLTPAGSRGAIELTSSPPVELASVASVCGSDLAQRHSLDSSDLGAAATSPLSTGGSVPSFVASLPSGSAAAAAAEQEEQAEKEQEEEQKEEEEEEDKLAAAGAQAVGAAGEAVAASGSAATATGQLAGAGAAGATPPEGQPASEAVAAAVADLQAKAAVAAEQAVTAAKGAAAAAGKAASAARAELEAKLPEWSVWVQEHPGSVMAGAGVTAAAIAALLLMGRRR